MNENKKPKLLLLSDLWGKEKSDWVSFYTDILEQHFDIKYYDCCELGNIDKTNYSEEALHNQFINGGIEKAVEKLLQEETQAVTILGFSIGGLIGWKAGNSGLKIENLFAISSTRLRYETQKPLAHIELFYGEIDIFKPKSEWFEKFDLKENLFENENHEFYQKKEIAGIICDKIIDSLKLKI
ncbi:alpha/beta hydrolase [Flavobacterium ardleyense]|uniref:Alpha/beta hydrolase n=1 Tax=Flavobacterium ardleyense TaxID=2038737 RepID=A0ABW5ZB61_9FLAO